MNRPPLSSLLLTLLCLSFVPLLVIIGVSGMPTLSAILASKTADILGVWVITWGLIAMAIIASVGVAWLAWTSGVEAAHTDVAFPATATGRTVA